MWRSFTFRLIFRLLDRKFSSIYYFRYSFRRGKLKRFVHSSNRLWDQVSVNFYFIRSISVTISIESKIFRIHDRQTRSNQETLKSQSFRWIDGPMSDVFTKEKQSGNSLYPVNVASRIVIENRNSVLDSVDRVSRDAKATE